MHLTLQLLTSTVESKEIIYWPITFTENGKKERCIIKASQQFLTHFWVLQRSIHTYGHMNDNPTPPPVWVSSHITRCPPPPCSLKRAGTRLDWVSLLRGETPALLRQWLLMSPASNLRSRRIHHRTDGCTINIPWMTSQDSDLDQWSLTFDTLLDSK